MAACTPAPASAPIEKIGGIPLKVGFRNKGLYMNEANHPQF